MDKFNYIIYHKGCLDGYTGFYLFIRSKQWEPKPYVYPDVPSAITIPPEIDGKTVIIIDVAYKPEILHEIAKRAKSVLFIDHHKSNIDEIKLDPPHKLVYDIDKCGATLVWQYFYGGKDIPRFVQLVEDNDLGHWKYEDTLPFITAIEVSLSMKPHIDALRKWDNLNNESYLNKLINKGKVFEEYKKYLIKKVAKDHTVLTFPSQVIRNRFGFDQTNYQVAVINGGTPSTSLVGKFVVDNYPVDFCFLYRYDIAKKRYYVSLRSKEADVSEIAKKLGGGGHKLASGFVTDIPISDLFD